MHHYKLEHVKTYCIESFSAVDEGWKRSAAEVMWFEMHTDFKCHENVGMIFYKDGTVETLGSVNMNSGVCDDCKINVDDVVKIELFKLV